MPVVIAGILRAILLAIVSAIPITIAQEVLDGTIKKLVDEIRSETGLSLDDAKDIIANILIDLAINSAILGTVIKGKYAVKVAEYLGFTSKGFKARTLTKKAAEAVAKVSGPWEKFKAFSLMSKVLSVISAGAATVWLGNTFVQAVEPGIYKPTDANRVWKKFIGIEPFPEPDILESPPPFGAKAFIDYAESLERAGVIGINDTFKRQTVNYTRKALAELVFAAYGDATLRGQPTTIPKFTPTLNRYFIRRDGGAAPEVEASEKSAAPVAPIGGATSTTRTAAPQVKVLTGVISQGQFGGAVAFTPRESDLISTTEDLNDAARNNLASFIASVPNRIVYEIKLASSVQTRDGFVQRGTTQRIISRYAKTGTPIYKTVTNKFAVADVFVLNETGKRTKMQTIVLGPVDAIAFQPDQTTLAALASGIKSSIVTSSVEDINKIVTTRPPEIVQKNAETTALDPRIRIESPTESNPTGQFFGLGSRADYERGLQRSVGMYTDLLDRARNFGGSPDPRDHAAGAEYKRQAEAALQNILGQEAFQVLFPETLLSLRREAEASALTVPPPPAGSASPQAEITSITRFYEAQGKALPTVQDRAKLYEAYGLGSAAYYTGTAEQNIKLLAELKRRNNP